MYQNSPQPKETAEAVKDELVERLSFLSNIVAFEMTHTAACHCAADDNSRQEIFFRVQGDAEVTAGVNILKQFGASDVPQGQPGELEYKGYTVHVVSQPPIEPLVDGHLPKISKTVLTENCSECQLEIKEQTGIVLYPLSPTMTPPF